MRQRMVVEKGQCFIQQFLHSSQQELWEVASLSPDTMQFPHARLVRVSDRTDTKTLSCSALNGKHGFSPTNQ